MFVMIGIKYLLVPYGGLKTDLIIIAFYKNSLRTGEMWKALESVTPTQEIWELPQPSKADILKLFI